MKYRLFMGLIGLALILFVLLRFGLYGVSIGYVCLVTTVALALGWSAPGTTGTKIQCVLTTIVVIIGINRMSEPGDRGGFFDVMVIIGIPGMILTLTNAVTRSRFLGLFGRLLVGFGHAADSGSRGLSLDNLPGFVLGMFCYVIIAALIVVFAGAFLTLWLYGQTLAILIGFALENPESVSLFAMNRDRAADNAGTSSAGRNGGDADDTESLGNLECVEWL